MPVLGWLSGVTSTTMRMARVSARPARRAGSSPRSENHAMPSRTQSTAISSASPAACSRHDELDVELLARRHARAAASPAAARAATRPGAARTGRRDHSVYGNASAPARTRRPCCDRTWSTSWRPCRRAPRPSAVDLRREPGSRRPSPSGFVAISDVRLGRPPADAVREVLAHASEHAPASPTSTSSSTSTNCRTSMKPASSTTCSGTRGRTATRASRTAPSPRSAGARPRSRARAGRPRGCRSGRRARASSGSPRSVATSSSKWCIVS